MNSTTWTDAHPIATGALMFLTFTGIAPVAVIALIEALCGVLS